MAVRFLNEALAGFKVDGVAMTTFVGQNLGAGQTGRTKRGARFGILATVILAEPIGIVVFWLAPQLITAFDSTPEVIRFGVEKDGPQRGNHHHHHQQLNTSI